MKMTSTTNLIVTILVFSISFSQSLIGTGADGPLWVPEGETYLVDEVRTIINGNNSSGLIQLDVNSSDGFEPGDEIIIVTSLDPTRDFSQNLVGQFEFNIIQSVSEYTLQISSPIVNDYDGTGDQVHQVVRIPHFTSVDIDGTMSCSAWNGEAGGILSFRATGTVYVSETGEIDASGSGYRGGWQQGSSHGGGMGGESYIGIGGYGGNYNNNDATEGAGGGGSAYANHTGRRGWAGGGGGGSTSAGIGSPTRGGAGGGGAGHAGSAGGAGYGTPGFGGAGYANNCYAEDGGDNTSGDGCVNYTGGGGGGGGSYGQPDLSLMYFGSGGGRGGVHSSYAAGPGGAGGGILHAFASRFEIDGSIYSDGGNGNGGGTNSGGGGGGAGGSLFLSGVELVLNGEISATGGDGGSGHYGNWAGAGGDGIIRLDFTSSILDTNSVIEPEPSLILNPNGIIHQPLITTNDATGPYLINADIYSDSPILSASVFYRVNGGSFSEIDLTTLNDTTFTAEIPGQLINSVIDYYLTASDESNDYYSPESAPAFVNSFMISGFAPQDLVIVDNNDHTAFLSWSPPVDEMNLTAYSIYRSEVDGFTPGVSNQLISGISDTSHTDSGLQDFHLYHYAVGAGYDYDGDLDEDYVFGSILIDNPDTTTVLGYAYLEAQSNHANIKIKFHPISPSATLDSAWTNALGYFEKHINPGVYDITYEKSGYGTYNIISNQSIIADLNLGESTLGYLGNENISGNISGVWDGTYTITGNVTIQAGDTLTVMPGTHILFYGGYHFSVNGYLNAVGAEGDSIIFRPINYTQIYANGFWQGIDFNDSSDDSSILKYALVEYAVEGVYWNEANATLEDARIHNSSGNGIYVNGDSSDPNISRVNTHNNSGNGLYTYNGDPLFTYINSHHNSGYGAYYNYYSHGSTKHSMFNNNSSHGIRVREYCWTNIDSSEVKYNGSWGVRIDFASPWFGNTEISHNSGYGVRYNQDNNTWSTPRFYNCLVEENTSHGISFYHRSTANSYIRDCTIRNNSSVGIYLYYDNDVVIEGNTIFANHSNGIHINDNHYNDPDILSNVIIYNWGDGIYKNNIGSPIIKFNTIYGNYGDGIEINHASGTDIITHNIIINNGQSGIRSNAYIEVFEYNLIYENLGLPITNLGNVPVDTWDFVSFNANGDSADIYLNIVEPAQFAFSDTTDMRLSFGSSAINSGDPALFDPDETVADMGALYFDFGNPRGLQAIGYGDESVTVDWNIVNRDSLSQYNVYYKHTDSTTYNLALSTVDTSATVSGLVNNDPYHFSVTSQYLNTESIFSPHVSELPGLPQITINPDAFNFDVDADTVDQVLSLTNSGTRNLAIDLPLGMNSGSVRYDGSGDYTHMANHSNHDVGSALTLECWIKRYNNGHIEFAGKHYLRYSFYLDSGNRLGMYKGYDSGNNLYQNWGTSWELPENEWHHVAVTWTGNVITFYADGEVVGEYYDAIANNIPTSGYNFQLGRRADTGSHYLNGHLAEVKLWNVVRTQEQIRQFMNSPMNGDEENLMGYWPMHNDYTDHSVYGRNGTSYGQTHISGDNPPTLPLLPFVLPVSHFDLAPGENVDALFRFYNTGEILGTSIFTTPIFSNDHDNTEIDYEISATYTTQVPSTPVYYSPVAATGLPYTIVVSSAMIDDAIIGVGDEIGVFDGELCVGAGVFDGNFNFVLTAWEGDESQDLAGFTPGNSIDFRIYDTSADLEATVESTYSIGNGNFGYGQFTAVSLSSTVFQLQEVIVDGGLFNLISFNLLPRYTNANIVFDDLDSLRIAYNDMGAAYIPEYNINSLGDIDFREGFHTFSSSDDTLYFEGIEIEPSEWDITVSANRWNSIAYLGNTPLDVTTVFPDTLIDSISIVQTFDGSVWIPEMEVNTIGDMMPGYGYQIALNGDVDITFAYQTDGGLAKSLAKDIPDPEHFQFVETGMPYSIIIDINDEDMKYWAEGDELAVFSENKCIGAAVFIGDNRMVITAWEGDAEYNLPGFSMDSPDQIDLKIYRSESDSEFPALFNTINGISTYGQGGFAHIAVVLDDGIPLRYNLDQNYPNPFNPVTHIRYELPQESNVNLTIYTLNGQKVKSLVDHRQNAGYYNILWNGESDDGIPAASGIYFYHLKAGSFEQTHKMLLLK